MSRVKLAVIAAIAILAIIVVLQNTEAVDTRLLFATVRMPRAALLAVTLLIGYVLGLASAGSIYSRAKERREKG